MDKIMLNKAFFKKHIKLIEKSIKSWEKKPLIKDKELKSFAKFMVKTQKARLKEFNKCLESLK